MKQRNVEPHRKSVRPRELQKVSGDLDKMVKRFCKSPDKKRFDERFRRR